MNLGRDLNCDKPLKVLDKKTNDEGRLLYLIKWTKNH